MPAHREPVRTLEGAAEPDQPAGLRRTCARRRPTDARSDPSDTRSPRAVGRRSLRRSAGSGSRALAGLRPAIRAEGPRSPRSGVARPKAPRTPDPSQTSSGRRGAPRRPLVHQPPGPRNLVATRPGGSHWTPAVTRSSVRKRREQRGRCHLLHGHGARSPGWHSVRRSPRLLGELEASVHGAFGRGQHGTNGRATPRPIAPPRPWKQASAPGRAAAPRDKLLLGPVEQPVGCH